MISNERKEEGEQITAYSTCNWNELNILWISYIYSVRVLVHFTKKSFHRKILTGQLLIETPFDQIAGSRSLYRKIISPFF
jgi:hypothetical protein